MLLRDSFSRSAFFSLSYFFPYGYAGPFAGFLPPLPPFSSGYSLIYSTEAYASTSPSTSPSGFATSSAGFGYSSTPAMNFLIESMSVVIVSIVIPAAAVKGYFSLIYILAVSSNL